jgi:tetratricopeptide (TPR) repeat protein
LGMPPANAVTAENMTASAAENSFRIVESPSLSNESGSTARSGAANVSPHYNPSRGESLSEAARRHVLGREWAEGRRAAMRALGLETDPVERFRLWHNLAACHWGLAEYGSAADAIEAAAEILGTSAARLLSDRDLGNHFNNLGLVAWKTWNLDGALTHYEDALCHYERIERADLCASVLNNIGCVMTDSGRFAEARGYLKRAEAVYARLGDHARLAQVYDSLRECSEAVAKGEGA